MIKIEDKAKCTGCMACAQKCPRHCITFKDDKEGFFYPQVDLQSCVDCGLCEKVCPVISPVESKKAKKTYAAINRNLAIRNESSSGGIFTLLAEAVLNEHGVVFGARFDSQWNVVHNYTESIADLSAFRGSKYVQSRVGDSYIKVERFLKEGRKVLFSGSPCQVAGLHKFLKREYENLVTVDFVCHGVPSPMIWRDYLNDIIRPKGVDGKNMVSQLSLNDMPAITGISFRDKRNGWKKFGFSVRVKSASKADKNLVSQSVEVDDRLLFYEPHKENLYMKGFLKNLYLRPSCYACPAKAGRSGSDYTLADFWGARDYVGDFDDDQGLSAVLIYHDKLNIASLDMDFRPTTMNKILSQNPAIVKSSRMKGGRAKFFARYEKSHQVKLINKYTKYTLKENLRYSSIKILANLHLVGLLKSILRK